MIYEGFYVFNCTSSPSDTFVLSSLSSWNPRTSFTVLVTIAVQLFGLSKSPVTAATRFHSYVIFSLNAQSIHWQLKTAKCFFSLQLAAPFDHACHCKQPAFLFSYNDTPQYSSVFLMFYFMSILAVKVPSIFNLSRLGF